MRVFTIGHSTRTFEELVDLLREHGVTELIDVRAHPGSRKFPHFQRESLAAALPREDILYRHVPELGGRRRSKREDSPNTGWRSASFRAYADHLESEEFERGLNEVLTEATERDVALMCSEAVPWRCHRMLISDALASLGVEVRHIVTPGAEAKLHRVTPFADLQGVTLRYPP